MRRRQRRHIEIFSISALDLFASALGAFILVTMILFPYYGEGRAAANQRAARDAALQDLQAQLNRARAAGPPFLLVQIRWAAIGADIDLHVTDPASREFYWYKANLSGDDYPGSAAALSYDMTSGPAVELWQNPAAQPGTYRIDYVANALPGGDSVEVSGAVFDRSGRHDLAARTLRHAKERVHAATITVGADGGVAFR
jgi:hypothetical protein